MKKKDIKFVFGIMAYNQEKEILFTLNSIKYQVLEYGKDVINTLIITDDNSMDRTTEVIDLWLKINGTLFGSIIKRFNAKNKGVVDNYHYILDRIEDEPFKIIAGDDVISRKNIYLSFDRISGHTLYIGNEFFFKNERVHLEQSWLYRHFYLMNHRINKKHYLRLFKMGFVISTPQTLYSKELYTDSNARALNSKFRLFEDNPTWYSMIKNISDLDIIYAIYPVVLYRISEKSISNQIGKVNNAFQNELYKLHDQYIQDGGLFDKIYFRSLRSNAPKFFNFSKYIDKIFFFYCRLYSRMYKKKFELFMDTVNEELVNEQKHLSYIAAM
ncbi:MAG: glycosyltransferase family 2 protein [Lachnospiraceae bacterium]|nr:glycosyltransferase family 2 protein [Lachnospiraceae bacterium]